MVNNIDLVLCHPDVIMDMFQAPTLLEDPFSNTSMVHTAEMAEPPGYPSNGKYSNILRKGTKVMQLMFVVNQMVYISIFHLLFFILFNLK